MHNEGTQHTGDTFQQTPTTPSESSQDTNVNLLAQIVEQLQRIGDNLNQPAIMQVSEEDALQAWGLRIYEDEFLQALTSLGIEVI